MNDVKVYPSEDMIWRRLHEDYAYLQSEGYEVVSVSLVGSQNYGLSIPSSDIDTKAIVLPDIDQIARGSTEINFVHIEEDGSHLEVKDIVSMFDSITKQNINFLEPLFTKYYILNSKYEPEMQHWFDTDTIAHFNVDAAMRCMSGTIHEKRKRLERLEPTGASEAETASFQKYGYDVKNLCHIARIFYALDLYSRGYPFRMCIQPTGSTRKMIMDWRSGKRCPSREEAIAYAAKMDNLSLEITNGKDHVKDDPTLRQGLRESIHETIAACLTKFYR